MPPRRTRFDKFLKRLAERLKLADACSEHGLRITRRVAIMYFILYGALISSFKFGASKLGTTASKAGDQLPAIMASDDFESYAIGGERGGIIGGEGGDILNGGTGWAGAWVIRQNAK